VKSVLYGWNGSRAPTAIRGAVRAGPGMEFSFPTEYCATSPECAPQALELVVNNPQFQGIPGDPAFRDLQMATLLAFELRIVNLNEMAGWHG
jgi:hypothetical protein